jgi:hypothetical protein
MLEANPAVTTCCERPVLASNQHDPHADFWLQQDGRPQYLNLAARRSKNVSLNMTSPRVVHATTQVLSPAALARPAELAAWRSTQQYRYNIAAKPPQNLAIEGIGLPAKWDDFTSIIRQHIDK